MGSNMRQLLLLALVCLIAVQTAAASRRLPLATVAATNNQHVQFTVAMSGVTCKALPARGTQPFTDRFRGSMRQDVINFLNSKGQTQAVGTIKSASSTCADLTFQGQPWASIRAHVWFSNVTDGVFRDTLFNATREAMCKGGYLKNIYSNVNSLMVENGLKVGHNNGSRCPRVKQTSQCTVGWIPYADPNNPACVKTSPTPSPSPSPSPQPNTTVTIYTSTTDVVIQSIAGGCANPQVDPLHNDILRDYENLVKAQLPPDAIPYTIFFKLPCQEGSRRRSLLADMNVVLGCGTNTTMPVAAEIAQEVGESVEFKSEVVQSATLNNVTVDEIVTNNVTVSNGTLNPPTPEPSPSPAGPCPEGQLQLYTLVNGRLVESGCADADSSGCRGFATLRVGGATNGGAATGCLQSNACPDSYGFAWYIAPTSGRSPVLRECWEDNSGNANCDGLPFSATGSTVEMAATISTVSAANLRGCTVATAPAGVAFCPERFRFFAATSTGALPNPVAGEASCASTAPLCTGKVAVIDSANADAIAPILGCLGTAVQLPTGASCPSDIPQVLSIATSYTLFVAPGNSATNLVVGGITSCRRRTASSSCGSMIAARKFESALLDGCFTGNLGMCPGSATPYGFPLYGPQPSGSAPVIEQCSTAPTGVSCSNIGGGVYTVAVTNGGLNDIPAPTQLDACQKPSTACPAGISGTGARYPLISNTGIIRACRSVQTACPAGSIPLCRSAGLMPTDGTCAAANTMGCVDSGAARAIACYSRPANGYPTSEGYPLFAAALNAGSPASLKSIAACYADTITGCTTVAAQNTTTTYTITARNGAAFSGCTDTNVPSCTSWWQSEVGPQGVCSN